VTGFENPYYAEMINRFAPDKDRNGEGLATCILAAAYVVWRFRPGYALYTWGGLLAPLLYIFEPRAFMSAPRFVLPLFPIFWAGAVLVERGRLPKALVVGVSAAGLGLLTSLFVTGYYIF